MPGPNEVISSARAKVFVVPRDGTDPLPIGLVEDLTISKAIKAENFEVIGEAVAPDNCKNTEVGRLRWTNVHRVNPDLMKAITPRIRQWTEHQSFQLLILDPVTNEPIAACVGVQPEAIDFSFRGGAAARMNFSGICRYTLSDEEVSEANAA